MYCVFNATTTYDADTGNPLGWPLEADYGYFCDQRDKGKFCCAHKPFELSREPAKPKHATLENQA